MRGGDGESVSDAEGASAGNHQAEAPAAVVVPDTGGQGGAPAALAAVSAA